MSNALNRLVHLPPVEAEAQGVFYTPREIHQQPEAWLRTAERALANMTVIRRLLGPVAPSELVLSGAGTSDYVGRSLETLLRASLRPHISVRPSTDIAIHPETTLPKEPFILVSFARSGNSPEGNAAFRLAEQLRPGTRHLVFTCNPDGELAGLAREVGDRGVLVLLPPETNDRGLAMTSSYTSLVIAGQILAHVGTEGGAATYQRLVQRLSEAGKALLEQCPDPLAQIARLPFDRMVVCGSGALYGGALEAHLKVQELTAGKVVCKAESTLGLRHGPMAVISPGTLLLLMLSSDPYVRLYEMDLLRELRAKQLGLHTLVICDRADEPLRQLADSVIETDPHGQFDIPDAYKAPLYVVPAQILAVLKSLELGLRPDSPSPGGVINRVVQGVHIYPFG